MQENIDNHELDNIESTPIVDDASEEKITKIERIKYLIMALIWFSAIPLSLLGTIFKPLYKKVYYGQANGYFQYGLGIFLLVIYLLVIVFVILKKMNLKYEKDKTPLSWLKVCILFFGAFAISFVISACLGFELKPFYDVGNNTTAYMAGVSFVKLAYNAFGLFFAIMMIENFQYAIEGIIPIKNKNVEKYIPYGGIATMIIYGTYALCFGVGGSLKVLYFFLPILYGEIYLLAKRDNLKAYATSLLIFLL